jgi:cell division protein ZapE
MSADSSSFAPPARFADATFASYRPETPQQAEAARAAQAFTERIRRKHTRSWLDKLLGKDDGVRDGLYLVGPVGTGKTHLLTAIYKALTNPEAGDAVPCAFTHSSDLFRSTETPVAYAHRIARQARVLLIDEVELDDPAGEVRLIGVLKALREDGVTVAATSNAEPDKFVSARFGRDRLERFINEEFRERYHVVFVEGEDYRKRLEKRGVAWIGPMHEARRRMREHAEQNPRATRWIDFPDLLRLTRDTERTRLAADLTTPDALYVHGIRIADTDDALRLLRVVDDLYTAEPQPALFLTAEKPPPAWFQPDGRAGIEADVAEKFHRTASRIAAMCETVRLEEGEGNE